MRGLTVEEYSDDAVLFKDMKYGMLYEVTQGLDEHIGQIVMRTSETTVSKVPMRVELDYWSNIHRIKVKARPLKSGTTLKIT